MATHLANRAVFSFYNNVYNIIQVKIIIILVFPTKNINGFFINSKWRWPVKVQFGANLIALGFNDTSTLVGHFVSSSREREKRDRRDSRGDEREGHGRNSEENEWKWRNRRNKNIPPLPLPAARVAGLAQLSQYQLGAPVTQDTWHLCLTQPSPTIWCQITCEFNSNISERGLFSGHNKVV